MKRSPRLREQVAVVSAPFADAVERLDTIPGIDRRNAEVLVAELGVSTCVRSRPRATWLAGPDCAQATTRAPAGTNPVECVRATIGSHGPDRGGACCEPRIHDGAGRTVPAHRPSSRSQEGRLLGCARYPGHRLPPPR